MSEANSPPNAASLYPADGGAAAAAAAQAATTTASAGDDTVAGAVGTDSISAGAGNDTIAAGAGNDTVAGGDTAAGTEAGAAGNDSIAGAAGTDSLTADSYQFTIPEGLVANDALTVEARAAFLEAGVNPTKAQSLIDLFGRAVKASQDAAVTAHNTEQQSWLQAVNSLPEFQGPTRETSLQAIGALWDEYGTPEAKAALDRLGTGNNPALAKMFLKIANVLSEGKPAGPGRPPPHRPNGAAKPTTIGEALYENDGRGPNAT